MVTGLGRAIMMAACALAAPAAAAPYGRFDGAHATFGSTDLQRGQFTTTFAFRLPADGVLSGQLTPGDDATAFTYARLRGPGGLTLYFSAGEQGPTGERVFVPQKMRTGGYTLEVRGLSQDGGSYQGLLRFEEFSVLPDPSAWLLMTVGFGGLGYTLRRRSMERKGGRIRFS